MIEGEPVTLVQDGRSTLGTIALGAEVLLGQIGLLLALVGILFAAGGAAIDTLFSGAYNLP
jgi:hypothetical protein